MATGKLSDERLKSKIETLGNAGNLNALPGSRPWAIAVRLEMQSVLGDIKFNFRQLKAWRDLIKEQAGYRQLVNERGTAFESYEEFCKAKPPYGLGREPSEIDQIVNEQESLPAKEQSENAPPKQREYPEGYLQRFSKVVEACSNGEPINTIWIAKILDRSQSTANLWRRRWLQLGWIQLLPIEKPGYYQITTQGVKEVKEWLAENSGTKPHDNLWLTLLPDNTQKVVEALTQSLDSEKLKELYNSIGKSLN